jgi:hypothetical protein
LLDCLKGDMAYLSLRRGLPSGSQRQPAAPMGQAGI